MVWDDPFYGSLDRSPLDSKAPRSDGEWSINHVYEGISQRVYWLSTRALATSLDVFFYYTIVRLTLTPWRARLNQLWYEMTTGSQTSGQLWSQWLQGTIVLWLVGILLGVLLWILTIKLFRQSPGQKIMRIYLIAEPLEEGAHDDQRANPWTVIRKVSPSAGALFWRALGFFAAALLLGLPYLSILFHPRGRTFYERWSGTLTWSDSLQSAKASWWWQDLRHLPQFFWLKWYQRVGVALGLTLWLSVTYQLINPWLHSGRWGAQSKGPEKSHSLVGVETNTCSFLPANLEELERESLRWLATIEIPLQTRNKENKESSDNPEAENERACVEQVLARYSVTEPKEDALLLFLRWWLWSDDPQAQSFIQKDCAPGKVQNESVMGMFCIWKDLWQLDPKLRFDLPSTSEPSPSPVEAFLRTRYHWFYQQDAVARSWLAHWSHIDEEVAKLWALRLSWPERWSDALGAGEDMKLTRLVSDLLPAKDQVEWLMGLCDRALEQGCSSSNLAAHCNWQEDKKLWQASLLWGEEQAYLRFYHTQLCQLKKRPDWWERAWLKLPRWRREKLKPAMFGSSEFRGTHTREPLNRTPAANKGGEANTPSPTHYRDWWIQYVIQKVKE